MPHVDEGQLHAYLDRGPGDATASEWATFEGHLAVCDDCQGRLEEARRLRDRAQEILASVGPPDVVAPPFESLVARSESGGHTGESGGGASRVIGPGSPSVTTRRRGWRSGHVPLVWAATVMIAVGAGWMARQVTMSSSEFGRLAQRPTADVLTESAEAPADESAEMLADRAAETPAAGTPGAPAETRTAMADQESLDRLEAKVDDEAAGRRANAENFANKEQLPSDRAAAKSVVVADAGRADDGAGERERRQVDARAAIAEAEITGAELAEAEGNAQHREEADREGADLEAAGEAGAEPAPLVTRDEIAQVDADNQRKTPERQVAAIGAVAQQPSANVPAAGHAAVGCYTLEVEWSDAAGPSLPARVRLLAEAATPDPSGGMYFRAVPAGRAYEVSAGPAAGEGSAFWLPLASDSVLVVFPGEEGFLELRLRFVDGSLDGVAEGVTPIPVGADETPAAEAPPDGLPAPTRGSIRARSIDCSGTD